MLLLNESGVRLLNAVPEGIHWHLEPLDNDAHKLQREASTWEQQYTGWPECLESGEGQGGCFLLLEGGGDISISRGILTTHKCASTNPVDPPQAKTEKMLPAASMNLRKHGSKCRCRPCPRKNSAGRRFAGLGGGGGRPDLPQTPPWSGGGMGGCHRHQRALLPGCTQQPHQWCWCPLPELKKSWLHSAAGEGLKWRVWK